MKKIYTFILLCTFPFFTKAQHTITAASNPVVGDIESYTYLNKPALFHGSSGTSQTWNYSGVTTNTLFGTMSSTYVPMSSVPNNFMFPGATIGADDGSGSFNVYSNNSTKIEIMGSAQATFSNSVLYSNPIKLYSLPFSYGTVSPDTYAFTISGYSVSGTFTSTGNGTGTLQLPLGSFSNVLKMNILVNENANSGSTVTTSTILISRYYSALSKFQLMEIQTYTSTQTTGTNVMTYYDTTGTINGSLLTAISEKEINSNFLTFPNPVTNGKLTISDPKTVINSASINNLIGQHIKTISFEDQKSIENKTIDVSDLPKGLYYLHLNAGEAVKAQKIIIE